MSILKKLFGGAPSPEPPKPETYKGFAITPNPANEGGRYRIGALIEKDVGGEKKAHQLIRADTLDTMDSAVTASIGKARQVIDEQGERIFG
ncbi:MAG: HlyU family transcriptional regulator [Silicimonas sp.]|nr:HlyU family transcriptional regulator [Silicimonas sp.]